MIQNTKDLYTIGTTSKLTNISVNTIRTWERRYFQNLSTRSETGRRFYDDYAVDKLRIIKTLSDSGMSVRDLANLEVSKLEELMINASRQRSHFEKKVQNFTKEAITITGKFFLNRIQHYQNNYIVLQAYNKLNELLISEQSSKHEKVTHLIDYNELRGENLTDSILELKSELPNHTVVIFYDFAPRRELQLLLDNKIEIIRTNLPQLLTDRYLKEIIQNSEAVENSSTIENHENLSPRRQLTDKQLYFLQEVNNNLDCECPNHISSLALSLVNFVEYSKNCENKDTQDEALHKTLTLHSSQALEIIENSIVQLCAHENIQLPLDRDL